MRIYRKKILPISEDVVNDLVEGGDIEIDEEQREELVLDVEAIIKEYLRMDEDINNKARDIITKRGLSYSEFGKAKRLIADELEFESGDKGIFWIANQIIECFMYNDRVEEVYSIDRELRIKIAAAFDRHLGIEEQVQKEVADRLKHLEEGSPEYEIEHQKLYQQIARRKGLV